MTDDQDLWTLLDEPSAEDFEAAEQEATGIWARTGLGRVIKAVVLLLVAVAVAFYLIAPFNNIFGSAPYRWRRTGTKVRTIPLAPPSKGSASKLPA